jgi:hypothetical protein
MTPAELQAEIMAELEELGFRPAKWLPLPELERQVRPAAEIAGRLMALDALFCWVSAPEKNAPTARLMKYVERNALRNWLAEDEAPLLDLKRPQANAEHANSIGWKLENMWPLAWALGFEPEPDLEAAQISDEVTGPMIFEFLPGFDASIETLLAKSTPRDAAELIVMEYRFYCAHNAVRSAQLGHNTVPEGFHPVVHGGAVHERRHSLTWCLSPDVDWDETDLST